LHINFFSSLAGSKVAAAANANDVFGLRKKKMGKSMADRSRLKYMPTSSGAQVISSKLYLSHLKLSFQTFSLLPITNIFVNE